MALVDNGPHTVTIFLEEETTDWRGNKVRQPSETAVVVKDCWMQPLASTRGAFAARTVQGGQDVSVAYKFLAREAPLGWWSRVEWVDEDGTLRRFATLGGPLVRGFSPATRHISCTLQEMR
jgi:hypothetical protein